MDPDISTNINVKAKAYFNLDTKLNLLIHSFIVADESADK